MIISMHAAAVAVLRRTRVEIDAAGCRWEYQPDGSARVTGPPEALAHLRWCSAMYDRWVERWGHEAVAWLVDSGLIEWLAAHPDAPLAVTAVEWRRRCPPAILRGARENYRDFLARHGGVDPEPAPDADADADDDEGAE